MFKPVYEIKTGDLIKNRWMLDYDQQPYDLGLCPNSVYTVLIISNTKHICPRADLIQDTAPAGAPRPSNECYKMQLLETAFSLHFRVNEFVEVVEL